MKTKLYSLFMGALLLTSCHKHETLVMVTNSMDIDRQNETVSLTQSHLPTAEASLNDFALRDKETGKDIAIQYVDLDDDGVIDELLFQPEVPANSTKKYLLVKAEASSDNGNSIPACFSRFVPERTDDYAWENNVVAFRTYGPTAQKMIEENIPGGTLSSGIDAWLKRVNYPIINKWYDKYTKGTGTYHEDTGEGLDNFHVGASRGIGGIAVKTDSSYYLSKNFSSWKTITTGPIRTSFVLEYNNWNAGNKVISEKKLISLDYGSFLSKFEITLKGSDTIAAGITLHEKKGETNQDLKDGWLSYWEPHADSELGLGIVVPNNNLVGYEDYRTQQRDSSNLYGFITTKADKAVYYAGFGWKKSGYFKNRQEWEAYLKSFSEKLKNPLTVKVL